MAKVNRDFLDPAYLTNLSRRALADYEINSPDSYASYLPSQEVMDIEYEIEKGQDGLITAANWRMFNGNTTSETWGKGEKQRGRLMPLSRNFTLDEETRLRMRNDSKNAIQRESAMLAERAAKAIAIQVNLQRINALYNAKVEINGSGGLRQTVDFGRKAEFDTTAAKLFTDETTDPIEYLLTLAEAYEKENGFRPEVMHMSSKVKQAIVKNPNVIKQATNDVNTTRATNTQVSGLLAEYDLPEIVMDRSPQFKIDDLETGETKVITPVPQDTITFTPRAGDPTDPEASQFGRTLWGATLSGDTPEFGLASGGLGIPGIVTAVIEEGWPSHLEVIADAIAMPVVYNANYTLKAKVI